MERSGDAGAGELPTFDAELEAPLGPGPGRPSGVGRGPRRRSAGRSAGLAVAALALLTAGIALGGSLGAPEPSAPTMPFVSPPAASPEVNCDWDAARPVPTFVLAQVGDRRSLSGRFGYVTQGGNIDGTTDWIVPRADERGSIAAGIPLEVRAPPGTCVRWVHAEYAHAWMAEPASDDRLALGDGTYGAVEPPTRTPVVGTLPDGEWVVRVTVAFETGVSGPAGQVLRTAYFRVRVGEGPFRSPRPTPDPNASPTPAVTPAVACGPGPADADAVVLVVGTGEDGADVPGMPEGQEPLVVTVEPGGFAEVVVVGDACATSWDIRLISLETGEVVGGDAKDNVGEDPAWAAQNRWPLSVPVGEHRLIVEVRLGPEVTIRREWVVVGLAFTIPEAFVIGADGSRVRALPGCGLSVTLANGYSAADSCGSDGYPGGLQVLHVAAWSPVRVEITGWTITAWYGSCGRIGDFEGGQYFEQVDGCWLGGYNVGTQESPPAPAQFLARPGELVVQLSITASRDWDTFNVPMYAIVAGE